MNEDSIAICPLGFEDLHEQLDAIREVGLPDWLDEGHTIGEVIVVHSWIRAFQATLAWMETILMHRIENEMVE